jgi:hypothetical protein
MPDFSSLPEVFVSNTDIAAAVSREAKVGRLRKIGSRLYTRNLKESPERTRGPLLRVMDFAQRFTAAVDFAELDRARFTLHRTNAFRDPNEADAAGIRLVLPSPGV